MHDNETPHLQVEIRDCDNRKSFQEYVFSPEIGVVLKLPREYVVVSIATQVVFCFHFLEEKNEFID